MRPWAPGQPAPGAGSVVAGARGRDKLVRVAGVTPDALRARLGA